MIRHDYAYPLRVDTAARQIARAGYPDHVNQLIQQLLLTSPGERVCLPEFGCGLRRLVFAPQSDALTATVKIQVQQAITTGSATRSASATSPSSPAPPTRPAASTRATLLITVNYTLVDTQTPATVTVQVS